MTCIYSRLHALKLTKFTYTHLFTNKLSSHKVVMLCKCHDLNTQLRMLSRHQNGEAFKKHKNTSTDNACYTFSYHACAIIRMTQVTDCPKELEIFK